jgi:hypothetical protein
MKKVLTVFTVLLAMLLLMPDAFAGDLPKLDAGADLVYK